MSGRQKDVCTALAISQKRRSTANAASTSSRPQIRRFTKASVPLLSVRGLVHRKRLFTLGRAILGKERAYGLVRLNSVGECTWLNAVEVEGFRENID